MVLSTFHTSPLCPQTYVVLRLDYTQKSQRAELPEFNLHIKYVATLLNDGYDLVALSGVGPKILHFRSSIFTFGDANSVGV